MTYDLLTLSQELETRGMLKDVVEHDSGVIICEYVSEPFEVALVASTLAGGMFQVHRAGIYWNYSRAGGWIMPCEISTEIEVSRGICRELTGSAGGWTHGANSGAILRWAVEKQRPQKSAGVIMDEAAYGYHECKPCKRVDMELLDMKGCYFQLLTRLPSLRFQVLTDGEVLESPMTPDERSRWKDALQGMAMEKQLRNSAWGKMLGSAQFSPFWCKGERKMAPPYSGSHQTAGYLIARMAYELCLLACIECDAVYAQTDGIIVPTGATPDIWKSTGMRWGQKGHGRTHVLGQHRYRCGEARTKWYNRRDTFLQQQDRAPVPSKLYFPQFLL